jgi:ATP-dependent Lhr-like helicase
VSHSSLADFAEPTRAWFTANFGEPTGAQAEAWPAIRRGEHVLLCAPTGSGKTLAAFLSAIDALSQRADPAAATPATKVLYISPLRALAVDVDKNLRAPIKGITLAAERLGVAARPPTVGLRSGDTPADERRKLLRRPPDILITTPESLYLMLTSRARETLASVETVIIDEIHAVAATKRGSHLALSLERLERVCDRPPQRIGLSATQRPLEEIAHFLGGNQISVAGTPSGRRPVTIVDAGVSKELDIEVVVPVEDMGLLGQAETGPSSGPTAAGPQRRSIWPSMHPQLLDLIERHTSTLVFVNARRLAERLAARLNELAAGEDAAGAEAVGISPAADAPLEEVVKAHHGSLAREQRLIIEDELKRGELRGLVATSSLELGIDMGAVDLVVQVESPGSVAAGLQRIGRAGHQVGAPSVGRIFPNHRSDLVECAVVVDRMLAGQIEHTRFLRNPLDVLAQQIVAMCALDEWRVEDLAAVIRAAAPFGELSDDLLFSTLDLLDGRYPSEEFAELRPRIVWDRTGGIIRGRAGAQRLAVTNPGTIPDRGTFGVFLPDGTRVGELDEEMVYESRAGETFLLGATTWRIEDITFERVIVTPAPGQPGKMPFWHGDGPGRPIELGMAIGEFVREIRALPAEKAVERLRERHHLDPLAATNLLAYLDEQAEITGAVPDDRTIVVERFRDEIGDWRLCVHSPFGARVNAPWGIALREQLSATTGDSVEVMWSDDGIIVRLPEAIDRVDVDALFPAPEDIVEQVVSVLPATAMFAARFRECSARALLLPRRRVDRRTPLWQQRQRAANLLSVASKYPAFPMLLETTRECINDVFDLPALVDVLSQVRSRAIRVVQVDTASASPMAQSLLFGWISVYMYEGDAPLAERRAAALALDRDLLRDLLGDDELRTMVDPAVLAALEDDLQRRTEGRRARDGDELWDLLRILGPLTRAELDERSEPFDSDAALAELLATRRAIEVTVAGERRFADAADAARLRDALGVAIPLGLPTDFTDPVDQPLQLLVERYSRTHGPFTAAEVAGRYGAAIDAVRVVLGDLEARGRVVHGEFRPTGVEREWCDTEVVRMLRRRTLAALRKEVEPVESVVLGRFLPAWHGVGSQRRGLDALVEVIAQLQGAPLVASALEADILPIRLGDYRPTDLDALCTAGDVVWAGAGGIGPNDGRIRLTFRDQAHLLIPGVGDDGPDQPHHAVIRAHLRERGASFWSELQAAVSAAALPYDDDTVLAALWDLVWAGEVTNDSLAPVRARLGGGSGRSKAKPRPGRQLGRLSRQGPPSAAGRWSLVEPLLLPTPTVTEVAHARAAQLLDRYGVLTREMALAEGVAAGFAGVYPVLKALEEQGRVRRGYFVSGLGAAQFAHPGAVDRLRASRDSEPAAPMLLAANDPAQPYGAVLAWPENSGRPARAAGARVVLVDGSAAAFIERGGRSVLTFPDADPLLVAAALDELSTRKSRTELATSNGDPIAATPVGESLIERGWKLSYRGLRPPDRKRRA